jgi:hypothetical protein
MWAYDFFDAPPRSKPLRTHLIANNLFLKFWFNEQYAPKSMRMGQNMRFIRMLVSLCIYGTVVVYSTSRLNTMYAEHCSRRRVCRASCVELHFPNPHCALSECGWSGECSLTFDGVVYDSLYRFPKPEGDTALFDDCSTLVREIDSPQDLQLLRAGLPRIPRIDVCFHACKKQPPDDGGVSLDAFQDDPRPFCGEPGGNAADEVDLICVDPDESDPLSCETMHFSDEVPVNIWDEKDPKVCRTDAAELCISQSQIIYGILYSLPFNFVVDILFMTGSAIRVSDVHDLGRSAGKCGLQWLIFTVGCALLVAFSSGLLSVVNVGRPEFFFLHWAIVVLIDQVRNIFTQIILWYFFLRRCGQVPVLDDADGQFEAEDDDHLSFFGLVRILIVRAVDSKSFELGQYALIGSYAVLVVMQIVIEDFVPAELNDFLEQVDTFFLILFSIEIMMLFLAQGKEYILNMWNIMDAMVIIGSIVAKVTVSADSASAEDQANLSMLRLLRILRLVMLLRKGHNADRRNRNKQKGALNFSSPVERVLEAFREIKETKGLTILQRDLLDWASEIIAQNKLFQISVDTDKSKSGDGFLEQEIQVWVKIASDNAEDSKTWGGDELQDWLLGKSRRKAKDDGMELAAQILETQVERAPIRDRATKYIEEMLDKWEFNVFDLRAMLGKESQDLTERRLKGPAEFTRNLADIDEEFVEMLPLLMLQCCKLHDVYSLFEIPPMGLKVFAEKIEQGYLSRNPYHNSIHACDVVQASAVLLKWCKNLSPPGASSFVMNIQDMLSVMFAAAIHDYEHPGFTNQFLNRTKHPIAVRYNDVSCLENHHAAAGFLCLIHADPDPLQNISESQYQQMRKAIIKMILSTDVANHLTELTIFKTKMSAKDFPTSRQEDKQVLMNTLLHAADISNPSRKLNVALVWSMRVMEEFFRQGDMEESLNFSITPFFDRNESEVAIPKCQLGFIDFMVIPLFEALGQFLPDVAETCTPNILATHEHYYKLINPNMGRKQEVDEGASVNGAPRDGGLARSGGRWLKKTMQALSSVTRRRGGTGGKSADTAPTSVVPEHTLKRQGTTNLQADKQAV